MTDVGIRVDQAELARVNRALTAIEAETLIDPVLPQLGTMIVDEARIYPPPVPTGQHFIVRKGRRGGKLVRIETGKYERTGALGAGWEERIAGGAGRPDELLAENPAIYAGFVMGKRQPFAWPYGWKRIKKIGEEQIDIFVVTLKNRAAELWGRQ